MFYFNIFQFKSSLTVEFKGILPVTAQVIIPCYCLSMYELRHDYEYAFNLLPQLPVLIEPYTVEF